MVEFFGYLGTLLINVAYLPQLIRTIKTKDISGLSPIMYVILIIAGAAWIVNGVGTMNIPIIVCNAINFVQAIIIFFFFIKNKKREKSTTKKT